MLQTPSLGFSRSTDATEGLKVIREGGCSHHSVLRLILPSLKEVRCQCVSVLVGSDLTSAGEMTHESVGSPLGL
jgi:hypothetical protein